MSYRVFLGRLPDDARERDIEKFFRGYGKVSRIVIKAGYAFIDFGHARDADDAIHELNGKELLGARIVLEHAKSSDASVPRRRDARDTRDRDRDRDGRRPVWLERYGPPTRTKYRVIVRNLSTRVSWQDLKDIVRKVSPVSFAEAHQSKSREGVIEFPTRSDMELALDKLNGADVYGRKIELIADVKDSRSRSASPASDRSKSPDSRRNRRRSRSRSRRSRTRSRSRSSSRNRESKKEGSQKSKPEETRQSRGSAGSGSEEEHANGRAEIVRSDHESVHSERESANGSPDRVVE